MRTNIHSDQQSHRHPHHKQGSYSTSAISNLLNAIDYKGEHCYQCGHTWKETGEMHFKHCKFYVSAHLIHENTH